MKRPSLIAIQVLCLFMVGLTISVGYYTLFSSSSSQWQSVIQPYLEGVLDTKVASSAVEGKLDSSQINRPDKLRLLDTGPYIAAILDPADIAISRLECPMAHPTRYEYLRITNGPSRDSKLGYFFALHLGESFELLPRLIGSIIETAQFLGPWACALSIVESRSSDGTIDILEALKPELDRIGLRYFLRSSPIHTETGEHTVKPAELRNMALAPLALKDLKAGRETTVIHLNDVAICMEDVLELIHQRNFQSADMTCAMDWVYVGKDPTFHDVLAARTMKGDTFFRIPKDGSWGWAWNLFWNDPTSRDRFSQNLPFQVYACWNGAVTFTAGPVLGLPSEGSTKSHEVKKVSFRAPRGGECRGSEPTLFCKDLWWAGFGKVAVVPSVNLAYSNEAAKNIKIEKGYASKWADKWGDDVALIKWSAEPPAQVKCISGWENQTWRPWNETLT